MPAKVSEARIALAQLVLRVGAGTLLVVGHGWPKLAHFASRAATFSDPLHVGSSVSLGLVVFAEVVCGSLVVLGLMTRWAVVPILIFLGVAIFIQHAPDPFAKKELALIYATAFAAVALLGPGRWSVDAARGAA